MSHIKIYSNNNAYNLKDRIKELFSDEAWKKYGIIITILSARTSNLEGEDIDHIEFIGSANVTRAINLLIYDKLQELGISIDYLEADYSTSDLP